MDLSGTDCDDEGRVELAQDSYSDVELLQSPSTVSEEPTE
jgi:hypothetical protein